MDAELWELFRVESTDRLQQLDHGLLRLEQAPGNLDLLEEAFREAHSLKGAARMLGLTSMQVVAHRLEDELNSARHGAGLRPESIPRLSELLAELRRLAEQAMGRPGACVPAAPQAPGGRAPVVTAGAATLDPARAAERFRIDAVRVDTAKLDQLMTHASELAVTKTRVVRRLAEMESVIETFEDWAVGAAPDAAGELRRRLAELHAGQAEDSMRLDYVAGEIQDGIRLARLLPLSVLFSMFARPVRDLAQEQGKEVELSIEGADTSADKRILEELTDPVMHLLRNAICHGIERPAERLASGKPRGGRLRLKARQEAGAIEIEIEDDGRGLDEAAIRRAASRRGFASEDMLAEMTPAQIRSFIFASGFSTASFVTDLAGRGVGLDVVRANVERLKGTVSVDSEPGRGTRFVMRLPTTLATARVLVVETGGCSYGLPVAAVEATCSIAASDLQSGEAGDMVLHRGQPVPVARLATLLELPPTPGHAGASPANAPCVFLTIGGRTVGLLVDAALDEQDVVLKPQCSLLRRVRNVTGATILTSGAICMVLNADDLLASLGRHGLPRPAKSVLVAEDSSLIRTQVTRMLEGAGYEVVAAVDGRDAWTKLAARTFDAVVADIQMPHLDGLELVARIRGERKFSGLPVVLLTSLASEADRKRDLAVGADAYLTKPAFDQRALLDCLARLA